MTTTTAPVATTRSGRPKVPRLDTAALTLAVEQELEQAVANLGPNPDGEDLLATYSRLLAEADETVATQEKHMYRLALSLHILDGARGVWQALGVSRETFSRRHVAVALGPWDERPPAWTPAVAERGRKMKVRYYSKAATELPVIAAEVYKARALQRLIIPMRDELLERLIDENRLTRVQVADIIRRNPTRVSHIMRGAAIRQAIADSPVLQAAVKAAGMEPSAYATAVVRGGESAAQAREKVITAGEAAGVADAGTIRDLLTH